MEDAMDGSITVIDIAASWLRSNGYIGLENGRCSCAIDGLMHCGRVPCRRCRASGPGSRGGARGKTGDVMGDRVPEEKGLR